MSQTITQTVNNKKSITTVNIILGALFIALVFIATYAVQIPLPGLATGGLIHLGNVALFTIAILFGKNYGAVAGGFGMALFDILSPWAIWAPGTLVIRFVMGYAVGAIANNKGKTNMSIVRLLVAMILPSIWMLAGYFGYNLLLYNDYPAAIASIPGDITQIVAGIVITLPILLVLNKTGADKTLKRLSRI